MENYDRDEEPEVYVMQSMIFGSKCSLWSAQYVKNQNALRLQTEIPKAIAHILPILMVDFILKKHYVDDYIYCVNYEDHSIQTARDDEKFIKKVDLMP